MCFLKPPYCRRRFVFLNERVLGNMHFLWTGSRGSVHTVHIIFYVNRFTFFGFGSTRGFHVYSRGVGSQFCCAPELASEKESVFATRSSLRKSRCRKMRDLVETSRSKPVSLKTDVTTSSHADLEFLSLCIDSMQTEFKKRQISLRAFDPHRYHWKRT